MTATLRIYALIALILAGGLTAAAAQEEDPEVSTDDKEIIIVLRGGPAPVDVEVSIGDEYVGTIGQDVTRSLSLEGLLVDGVNELNVKLLQPDQPRSGRRLEIAVVELERVTARRREYMGHLARIVVPADATAESACEDTVRFWVGGIPWESPPLKRDYYLFVSGPPATHRVTVWLNGVPVHSTNRNQGAIDITPFVKKGRNALVFAGTPTCLVSKSPNNGTLFFRIGWGEVAYENTIEMAQVLAFHELLARRKAKPYERKQGFRGW
ncbi:MAG: hypothetical protein GY842_18420 [bacterium]|nr:hypothetical protein [bacterium]